MPITRTTMIDDDGTGTTGTILNNAWIQTIYGQIDGVVDYPPTAWTPTDASGAGLVFTFPNGSIYVRTGYVVHFWVTVQFPTTTSGAQACIGGLPFSVGAWTHAGGFTTYGKDTMMHAPMGTKQFYLVDATGSARTNQQMSGALWIAQGSYLGVW